LRRRGRRYVDSSEPLDRRRRLRDDLVETRKQREDREDGGQTPPNSACNAHRSDVPRSVWFLHSPFPHCL
jgi:hypothetical protein